MKIQNGWKLVVLYGLSLLVVGALVYASKLEPIYLIAVLVAGLPGFASGAIAKGGTVPPPPAPTVNVAVHVPPQSSPGIDVTPAETPDAKKAAG